MEQKSKWSILSNLAVIASLLLVFYELSLNRAAILESNKIARMESSNFAYTGSTIMRQMIIDNKEIWNKACKGLELTEEEEIVRKMISSTWYFNHGQMYEQAVHLSDDRLIKSRISLPERFVKRFPAIKYDWDDVKAEYKSKGYEALIQPYEKAFASLETQLK